MISLIEMEFYYQEISPLIMQLLNQVLLKTKKFLVKVKLVLPEIDRKSNFKFK